MMRPLQASLAVTSRKITRFCRWRYVPTRSSPSKLSGKGVDLLLVDLEMPTFDGAKIFRYATGAGVDKNRIVILSGREAEYLHEHFPLGTCLAVLNKYEAKQKAVLDMIFISLQRKAAK